MRMPQRSASLRNAFLVAATATATTAVLATTSLFAQTPA